MSSERLNNQWGHITRGNQSSSSIAGTDGSRDDAEPAKGQKGKGMGDYDGDRMMGEERPYGPDSAKEKMAILQEKRKKEGEKSQKNSENKETKGKGKEVEK